MSEILEAVKKEVMHGFLVCMLLCAVVLLIIGIWRLIVHSLTRNRIESAKQIYNSIKLNESRERAAALFRSYDGGKEQYTEEAVLANGRHEEVLCLLFWFGSGETGEIRLTYIDDRLVRKQQNGLW